MLQGHRGACPGQTSNASRPLPTHTALTLKAAFTTSTGPLGHRHPENITQRYHQATQMHQHSCLSCAPRRGHKNHPTGLTASRPARRGEGLEHHRLTDPKPALVPIAIALVWIRPPR